ncbi:TRAP transporter substrate-binding protein [Natribacillus halophilus]|uniref:TRAP-type C4-dicarboxylate transport system, substrate-binding protein n=1 Tax=Natribacillus halophilus TaxID=549003 RepID=A0A1G8N5R5_9BACI|nr:TRAP transporter substrate-binding protein DctP [Natribacillus halophilus]SDI75544.1 TRAP-type C4-dicarboxylate transport system, substrate-binding protein [Natribacillus halophilus]
MKKDLKYAVMVIFTGLVILGCQAEETDDDVETDEEGTTEAESRDGYGPPDETTEWVFQPAFDSGDAGWANGVEPWIEDVEEATEGTIEIELLPAGSIVSGDEAFSAASTGTTDVYAGWATDYGGIMPEGMLAYGMAMGAESHHEAWAAMWGDPQYRIGELVQEAAHENNLHWAGWTNQGPNSIFSTFPVNSMEDLQGESLRAGGPQALFLEAMGGSPVSLEADEIYSAIDLGTVDGTLWDTGGINDMSYHEVIDYAMLPGWNPAQHQEIYVNLDAWNDLNDWQRDRIDDVFMSNYFKTSRMHAEGVEEALQDLVDSGGEVITLSEEEEERMRNEAIESVWPEVASQSERTAEGVELWEEFLRDTGHLE